jgi:hypothetical protein
MMVRVGSMPHMRRVMRHILIFGALGVAMSYLVAWGLLAIPGGRWPWRYVVNDMDHDMNDLSVTAWVTERFGATRAYVGAQGLSPSVDWAIGHPTHEDLERRVDVADFCATSLPAPMLALQGDLPARLEATRDTFQYLAHERCIAGWPMRCVTGHVEFGTDTSDAPYAQVHGIALVEDPFSSWDPYGPTDDASFLGCSPIWSGLLFNTALYGGGLWLFWLTPGIIRRTVRRRRGRCMRCGYDLRGGRDRASGPPPPRPATVCPECGGAS